MGDLLIGLVGYAQAGKDSVANVLCEYGWQRFAFADPLRHALYALNPIAASGYDPSDILRIQDIVDDEGWDYAKTTYPEVRELLQRLGTEVGRKVFDPDFWVNLTKNKIIYHDGNVVVTDARFQNEADLIHTMGGFICQVTRPGTGPVNGHASEMELDHAAVADFTIHNNGDLQDLHDHVRDLFALYPGAVESRSVTIDDSPEAKALVRERFGSVDEVA